MKIFLRCILVLTCLLAQNTGVMAQSTQVSAEYALNLAERALSDDKPEVTVATAQALLRCIPDNYQALILLSLAQSRLENRSDATRAAIRAFRVARTDPQKLQASRMAGAGHFKSGHFSRAEWWLRRAANFAPTPRDSAIVKREFETIRRENPLTVQLSFSSAPSSNVNSGSNENVFNIGDLELLLSADSLALSGIEYAASANFGYRLSQSKDHLTSAGFLIYGRTYSLSASSKASVPQVSGSDYALVATEVSLNHRRNVFANLGTTGISAHIGQNWFGGDPLWRYGRIALSQDFAINQRTSASLRGFVETEVALDDVQPDTLVYDIEASFGRRLPNRDVVRFSLGARTADTDFDTSDYTSLRGNLQYDFYKRILDTRLSLALGIGKKDYEEFALTIDGRHDKSISIGATAVFENISYYGFSPSLTLQARKTNSNFSRYSTDQITARLGIQSNF